MEMVYEELDEVEGSTVKLFESLRKTHNREANSGSK